MTAAAPSAEEELRFLARVRLLLADGAFVSTYKFALLKAISDECIERGETLAPLEIPIERLGERFIELYWRQARPYEPLAAAGEAGEVDAGQLLQNTGTQAGIVKLVASAQRATPLLSKLRQDEQAWKRLRSQVAQVVKRMPLFKLQTVGGRKTEFLYPERPGQRHVTLHGGVAWLLRKHHDLLGDLIEVAWIRFLQSLPGNARLIGQGQELGQFLFGSDRKALARVVEALHERQGGRCFYCERPMAGAPHVDHFIPWARYTRDLGHNFVLSDQGCNLDKSSYLPAVKHLSSWVERNVQGGVKLEEDLRAAGLGCDVRTSLSVAQWAYSLDFAGGAATWIGRRKRVEPASGACIMVVADGVRRVREAGGAT